MNIHYYNGMTISYHCFPHSSLNSKPRIIEKSGDEEINRKKNITLLKIIEPGVTTFDAYPFYIILSKRFVKLFNLKWRRKGIQKTQ